MKRLALTLMLLLTMSLSAHSEAGRTRKVICIICIGVDDGPNPVGARSWCKKWTPKRRRALTFTDAQIATFDRSQKEAFKSIKSDIRRECPPPK